MPHGENRVTRWVDTQKGQVLVIFALTAVVLFAIMGLAIDAGITYFHSDLQQRAAASAALSGVAYLPGDVSQGVQEAVLTAERDGYPNSAPNNVVVTEPTSNELEVAITAPAPVYFLGLLGFGTHNVTAYATAQYLPAIQLGQPGPTLGATVANLGTADNYYFMRTEGWGNPRSEGDAFTPTPTDSVNACKSTSCTASPADVHQISCLDDTEPTSSCVGNADGILTNDNGGYSYLIYVPANTTSDMTVYNPSFDPGNDSGSTIYTYHDDDSSFPALSSYTQAVTPTDYAAMAYTLFAVPVLYSRANDIPLVEDVFCPYNAWDLDQGTAKYSYYEANPAVGRSTADTQGCNNPSTSNPTMESVSGTPEGFHSYASLLNWDPSKSTDLAGYNLFSRPYSLQTSESSYLTSSGGNYYLNGGTGGQYYRLQVDTLSWDGSVINTSSSADTSSPTADSANVGSSSDPYPTAHAGYALQAVQESGTTSSLLTVSALGEMCLYTPIDATGGASSFTVPLFLLPTAYAGKVIAVRVFDPGDVGGSGNAYLGIEQPQYTSSTTGRTVSQTFASVLAGSNGPEVDNLGTSLGDTGSGTPITPNDGGSPAIGADAAVVETYDTSGGTFYNGQWVQFNIQVPSDYTSNSAAANPGYWDLYYGVNNVTAGDTITVQVQYLGSPVHLLPGS